jgi:hypothetical protein
MATGWYNDVEAHAPSSITLHTRLLAPNSQLEVTHTGKELDAITQGQMDEQLMTLPTSDIVMGLQIDRLMKVLQSPNLSMTVPPWWC